MSLVCILSIVPSILFAGNFHGSISQRYKFRSTGGFSDNDIETLVSLDAGQAEVNKVTGSVQGGVIVDLDQTATDSPFRSLYDSFSSRAVGRLYYGYADFWNIGPIYDLRIGRQHQYEFESLYYDGATLEFLPWHKLTIGLFGGVPVHLFENQLGFDPGDWLAGAFLEWEPRSNFRSRLDYVHLKDQSLGFRASAGDREDNLFGASWWLDLSENLGLSSRVTAFSDQVRDASLASDIRFPKADLVVRLNAYTLLNAYDYRVLDWDAYGIAGSFRPYFEIGGKATKGFGEHFSMDAGASARILAKKQVASTFNHGFQRYFLTLNTTDFPVRGMSLSATGDYYRGTDNTLKNNSLAASFTASQKLLGGKLKLSGGTSYYLYKYNLLAGDETSNVRTYFFRIDGKIYKGLSARGNYEFEQSYLRDVHQMDLRLSWNF